MGLGWVGSVAGGVLSMLGSNSAAGQAADAQNRATDLGYATLDWNKQRYNEANTMLKPLEQKQVAEALSEGPTSYFGQEKAAFQTGIGAARDKIMGQTGLSTGLQAEQVGTLGLNAAKGLATLQQQDNARKQQLLTQAEAAIQGQAAQAAAGVNSSSAGLGSTLGQQSGYYSQLAGQAMNAFSSSMNGLGKYFGYGNDGSGGGGAAAAAASSAGKDMSREPFL